MPAQHNHGSLRFRSRGPFTCKAWQIELAVQVSTAATASSRWHRSPGPSIRSTYSHVQANFSSACAGLRKSSPPLCTVYCCIPSLRFAIMPAKLKDKKVKSQTKPSKPQEKPSAPAAKLLKRAAESDESEDEDEELDEFPVAKPGPCPYLCPCPYPVPTPIPTPPGPDPEYAPPFTYFKLSRKILALYAGGSVSRMDSSSARTSELVGWSLRTARRSVFSCVYELQEHNGRKK